MEKNNYGYPMWNGGNANQVGQTARGKREYPRITQLTEQDVAEWKKMLFAHRPFLDTTMLMLYTEETIDTVYTMLYQTLRSNPGNGLLACAETRLELERIASTYSETEKVALARKGLEWYNWLKSEKLLFERAPFQYFSRGDNDYADPALLLQILSSQLTSRDGMKPLALLTRDNGLGEDALGLNQFKTLERVKDRLLLEPIKVFYVNTHARVVPFTPTGTTQSVRPVQPAGYGQPVRPVQPAGYGQPVHPVQPAGYGQPVRPVQPAGYGQPVHPVQPAGYGQSVQPGYGQGGRYGQTAQPTGNGGVPSYPGTGSNWGGRSA